MRILLSEFRVSTLLGLFLPLFLASQLAAQTASGTLRGRVTDPSGASVMHATVSVSGPEGHTTTTKTNQNGVYQVKALAPGAYTIRIVAPGFSPFEQQKVAIVAGRAQKLNISLQIEQQVQQVTVSAQASQLSVSPESNASSVVITGKALQSLSDDPDELEAELEALAGPAAGPSGGQIYIDGFTGGQLPPKSDILEIHVNQNPFSAEYDKVGYGRIEIITKPGSTQYHGHVFADGNDSPFDSRNPFVPEEPGYHTEMFYGSLGGPLSHKASFYFGLFRRDIQNTSIVDAFTLSPNLATQVPFRDAVPNPQTRMYITPHLEYQLSPKNVLVIRYHNWRDTGIGDGIGQFALASQGYNSSGAENALQLSDTQVVSARTVNQTRFEYERDTENQTPQNLQPAIDVLGGFMSGGSTEGKVVGTENYYELQNLTTMSLGKHTLTFGGRLRDHDDSNASTANFNGTFTFPTLDAYQLMEQGFQQGLAFAQIRAQGGGPSQFEITAGNPLAKVNLADAGIYGEDEWRARPNISLSLGLRFESQNDIHDHADFAPRMGFAWGIGRGKAPKTVLRAGLGLFYDRFEEQNVLQAERLNGINQQQYMVPNPNFFATIPPTSVLSALSISPTVYDIAPNLRAPYTIQSAIGLERQISKGITASVTYLNSHGVHQFLTRNINAPLPGLYQPSDPAFGRPFANVSACDVVAVPICGAGYDGNIYQYDSDGLYNQNELITNFRVNEGRRLMMFGYYTLNYANSNTSGAGSFLSNPYNILEDYGRATFDIRDRFVVGGAIYLPFGFRLMPFVIANSGSPFNITRGQDLLGSGIFNQRPAFAPTGATGPNIIDTRLGAFNIAPTPGEPVIPINYGTGPGAFTFNLHFSKTIGFGRREEGGGSGGGGYHGHDHGLGGRGLSGGGPSIWRNPENSHYNLTFGIAVHNVFNNVNLGTPVGNLGSPIFGLSNSLATGPYNSAAYQAANRRIDLQVRFTF